MFELDTSVLSAKLCPICGQMGDRKFRKHQIWILDCPNCNHRFAELELSIDEIAQIYDGRYFQGDGLGYLDYLAEANLLRQQGQCYAKQLEGYCWPGTVLDVGTAAGFILRGLMDCDWQGRGIEPNERIAKVGRQKLRLNITPVTLETFPKSECYDLVMMIQVLSHFYDLNAALEVASDVTCPGGLWLIETWNRNSWPARLSGKRWRAYQPPATQHWFSPRSLRKVAQAYGFEEVGQGGVTRWVNGPYLRSLLRYHGGFWSYLLNKLLAVIPNTWTMPWPVTDRFWAIYQKVEPSD
jgi:SAM-dependent methyltransferase